MKNRICYIANRFGYYVEVWKNNEVVETYSAGNCHGDSQAYVDPNSMGAVHPNTLRKYAKQTALEYAEEYGIPTNHVFYDTDLKEEFNEEVVARLSCFEN